MDGETDQVNASNAAKRGKARGKRPHPLPNDSKKTRRTLGQTFLFEFEVQALGRQIRCYLLDCHFVQPPLFCIHRVQVGVDSICLRWNEATHTEHGKAHPQAQDVSCVEGNGHHGFEPATAGMGSVSSPTA